MVGFLLIAMMILLQMIFRKKQEKPLYRIEYSKLTLFQKILFSVAIISFALSLISFTKIYKNRPEGAFDAWSIWNRTARFLYRDPGNWQASISPEFSWMNHTDYPLLIPLNVAWGWWATGTEAQHIPVMQGGLFLIASIGIIFSSISYLQTVGQGSLAALIFTGTPIFITTSAVQISDVPVMYYILSSAILLYLYFKYNEKKFLILSGLFAGLAGWTKNEGLLFIVVCFAALILVDYKNGFRHSAIFITGLIAPFLLIIYFKSLTPPGDLFSGSRSEIILQITDFSRYLTILKSFYTHFINFGGWPFPISLFLIIYAAVLQIKKNQDLTKGNLTLFLIILLQMAGYTMIFVVTPHDLDWHIKTALERLLLHIYPLVYFLYFLYVKPPDTLFSENKTIQS